MWNCGSLRSCGRRRRRRRRGVGQSSETCSQSRQRPLSSPSGFFPAVGGREGEANSRAESTVFSEARVLGEKVGVQCADGLQRPEEEKKIRCQTVTSPLSVSISTSFRGTTLKAV